MRKSVFASSKLGQFKTYKHQSHFSSIINPFISLFLNVLTYWTKLSSFHTAKQTRQLKKQLKNNLKFYEIDRFVTPPPPLPNF